MTLALAATTALLSASAVMAQDKTYTIPTVVKISGIQWFNRMEEGIERFAEETGHNAYQVGPAQADAQLQVQLIEDMIAQGADAITVVPFAPEAVEPVLKRAMEQDIVVITHEAADIEMASRSCRSLPNAWARKASMRSSSARSRRRATMSGSMRRLPIRKRTTRT
jgi:simple sugar transport system substrate-binding protein